MKKVYDPGNSLRNRVKRFLGAAHDCKTDMPLKNPEKLVDELRIHQIELELQNEDLCRAREALEQSRARYLELFESAPAGYLTLDEKDRIIEVNATAARLLNRDKSKILHQPFTSFVSSDFQDELYFYLIKVRNGEAQESCELKLHKSGGEDFFAHLESVGIHKVGSPAEIRTSFINVHEKTMNAIALRESLNHNEMLLNLLPQSTILIDRERKILAANQVAKTSGVVVGKTRKNVPGSAKNHARRELRLANGLIDEDFCRQRLIRVIEDSNDAVCLFDLRGNIMAWNRKAEKIYGYTATEALKLSIFDLTPFGLKQKTRQLLDDIGAGILVQPFETRRIAKNGSVVDICLTITRITQGPEIVAIATTERDITEHNRWFAALHALPGKIILAREKERSRVSQILHSELGQSLIALKLFTAASASEFSDADDNTHLKSIFNTIKTQLSKIIGDTRDLAHEMFPPGLKHAGLFSAIKSLVESSVIKKHLDIQFFHENIDQISIKNREIIIYRILQELLQNICKHSQATKASVSAIFRGQIFTLEVSDNGRGFPAPGETVTGMGLSLLREQVALIRGKMSIVSHRVRGTKITIKVPTRERKRHEGM